MIDSHCHLDSSRFNGESDQAIQRAVAAGVTEIVLIGMVPSSIAAVLSLAERHPERTRATAGVHPHESAAFNAETEAILVEALSHPAVTVLGEIGLDWFRNYAPVDVQQRAFRRQLELAHERGLPFVLHCRDAHDDCVEAIRDIYGSDAKPVAPSKRMPIGVAHCFSGNAAQAEAFLELGLLISWAGHLTYRKSEELRDAARHVDLAYSLVETDAPYLAPEPHRGKRNEPAYVMHTAKMLAEVKGVPLDEVDRATTANARRLFGFDSNA